MPHVIIKLWPGRTEKQKAGLCKKITEALIDSINVPDSSISVAIEEIPEKKWKEMVYDPDIAGKKDLLYKKPGYTPS